MTVAEELAEVRDEREELEAELAELEREQARLQAEHDRTTYPRAHRDVDVRGLLRDEGIGLADHVNVNGENIAVPDPSALPAPGEEVVRNPRRSSGVPADVEAIRARLAGPTPATESAFAHEERRPRPSDAERERATAELRELMETRAAGDKLDRDAHAVKLERARAGLERRDGRAAYREAARGVAADIRRAIDGHAGSRRGAGDRADEAREAMKPKQRETNAEADAIRSNLFGGRRTPAADVRHAPPVQTGEAGPLPHRRLPAGAAGSPPSLRRRGRR